MSSNLRHALVTSSLLVLLTACGGGGGSAASAPPGGGGSGGLNPGAAGTLYFATVDHNVKLDMASGTVTPIRARAGEASASDDGSEFVALEPPASGNNGADDLVIYGQDGAVITRFEVEGDLLGTPRLSPDKQHIAVRWDPPLRSSFSVGVAVFDRDGGLARNYAEATEAGAPTIRSWDWTPEGDLLFTVGERIVRVDPLVSPAPAPQTVATFTGDEPRALAVSPDGTRIAFTLGNPGNLEDHVYVMNADGTAQRQLTASALNETSPAWSPDGTRIAVRQGVTGGFQVPPSQCPRVYVVPADASALPLAQANPAPALRLQMMEAGAAANVCAFSDLDWR